jgi:virginiamycin B lyase
MNDKRRIQTKLIAMAGLAIGLPAICVAQQVTIGEYPLLTVNANPLAIAVGPDGALWFTEYNAGKIGRITAAGAVTEYPVPTAFSGPDGIVAGPDGALWFTESSGNKIGRITTSGAVTEYALPNAGSNPGGITAGPGAVWFTESGGNRIGRITAAGALAEYTVPTANSNPYGIAAGPDGAFWFTEQNAARIGRITPAGVITEFATPTANSGPWGITAGPDAALWFTEYNSDNVGRISTAGAIEEYPLPGYQFPAGITSGPDGALWLTFGLASSSYDLIGRMTTAGTITSYLVAGFDGGANQITGGPEGSLWFTNPGDSLGHIGQVVLGTANLRATPDSGSYLTNLTFAGSSFDPDENVDIYVDGVGSAVLASATTDASGSFTIMVREPQSSFGPRAFLCMGQSSGKLAGASFAVAPSLIPDPSSGAVGSTVTVQGYGFGAMEQVNVYWNNTYSILLGRVRADINGAFTGDKAVTFTVPAGAPTGPDILVGRGVTLADNGKALFIVK